MTVPGTIVPLADLGPMSVTAAEANYRALPEGLPGWHLALIARQVGQAHFRAGALWPAMEWCMRSWDHARDALRLTGGIPTFEIMQAYDLAAVTMARIYFRLEAQSEIQRLLDDLMAIHAQARAMLREYNETSLIPLGGQTVDIRPEELAGGAIVAILALAAGDLARAAALAGERADPNVARDVRALLLAAHAAAGHRNEALELLEEMRCEDQRADGDAIECEALIVLARLEQDAEARLTTAEAGLERAVAGGLGLCWRDLMFERARALRALDRPDEACEAAKRLLDGVPGLGGAHPEGDWSLTAQAASLLGEAGRTVSDGLLADLALRRLPPRPSPLRPDPRRPAASEASGEAAREEYHKAALRAVEAYRTEGRPFVLYLRKFGIEVLHGPFDQGPKLTENHLRDALPPEVEVVTVQDQHSLADSGSSRLHREAPALRLSNAGWMRDIDALIAFADLIVSEPLLIGEGVRLELEMIFKRGRWDRTVLLIPPLDSPFSPIDSEAIVQLFPRCVWADELHRMSFTDSPMVSDLIDRVRTISALPMKQRRLVIDRDARDAAYPVDMLPLAEELEWAAQAASVFGGHSGKTRYYGFWRMYRAAGIRCLRYSDGDRSAENRARLAYLYLEMSNIMLDHEREGDRIILKGDPADAQRLVRSAYRLVRDDTDPMAMHYRQRAENRWDELSRLEQVMKADPERFEIRHLYGPLPGEAQS